MDCCISLSFDVAETMSDTFAHAHAIRADSDGDSAIFAVLPHVVYTRHRFAHKCNTYAYNCFVILLRTHVTDLRTSVTDVRTADL